MSASKLSRRRLLLSSLTIRAIGLGVQRAVHGNDTVADIGLERQVFQKIEIVRAQLLPRPGDGARRGA